MRLQIDERRGSIMNSELPSYASLMRLMPQSPIDQQTLETETQEKVSASPAVVSSDTSPINSSIKHVGQKSSSNKRLSFADPNFTYLEK